jgi:CheY-like chemotaxis protein
MLEGVAEKARQDCDAKQLKLTTHFDKFTPKYFVTDGARLQHILLNLLNNAIKYTPEFGNIDIIIEQKERRNGKSLFWFAVRDTGVGIAPNYIEKIFHPFEQIGSGFDGGTGLGLTIVRRTLKLFGTDIHVLSELGKGSEFSFEVWIREKETQSDSRIENMAGCFTGQRALVVDDVRLNRIVLVNLLHEAGFEVDEAEDGKQGLEMFERSSEGGYSIVLMDIQMPVMNGWESTMEIRKLPRPDAKTVPIVAISANAFQDDIEKSYASGMNAHYAKPIQREILSEILKNYCRPKN